MHRRCRLKTSFCKAKTGLNTPQPAGCAKQQGIVLFVVLMMMLVIALFSIAASQSYHTEQRISANDADHRYALSLAEAALSAGEQYAATLAGKAQHFSADCQNGLCSAVNTVSPHDYPDITVSGTPTQPAWLRQCDSKKTCLEKNGRIFNHKNSKPKPRYIIEFIKINPENHTPVYRITAQAWGKNAYTSAMIQSYIGYK
ncbi:PilX N-terminal domain-containing pilus assembly protein [Neisseria sp. ZJ106]|uniref:PilX N-terminal domain-containing pilus assembly protein n=1 Tax=Neisseria lisongii TaxID=2912188 RepID=A0ABY7RL90_9NEIS|nr:PilX N-terminal domain-containing pilus assembly protein [Neisseria lisongii]MCF7521433.1 PilX N-terminal domain-containing pilus assembly protein [Neisseria lisongii]WCL72316.1 PilX N-terminal domain-containing pilus assembly protein [Neisseria lisongii]